MLFTITRPSLIIPALRFAQSQIGTMESPLGSNRGPMVDQYHRAVGLSPAGGNAWCASFVYWCFQQAAEQARAVNPAIKSAHCLTIWRTANNLITPKQVTAVRAKANYALIKPGMIFIMEINKNTGAGHTGFIESVNYRTGVMTTVEGNSNENGSREGLGVFRLNRRRVEHINIGFIEYT